MTDTYILYKDLHKSSTYNLPAQAICIILLFIHVQGGGKLGLQL